MAASQNLSLHLIFATRKLNLDLWSAYIPKNKNKLVGNSGHQRILQLMIIELQKEFL